MSGIQTNHPLNLLSRLVTLWRGWRNRLLIIVVVILIYKLVSYEVNTGSFYSATHFYEVVPPNVTNELAGHTSSTRLFHNISNYSVIGNNRYFIYSVLGEPSGDNNNISRIVFNGWEVRKIARRTPFIPYLCCLQNKNGVVRTSIISGSRPFFWKAPILANQIVCDVDHDNLPEFVTLVLDVKHCNKNASFYRPEYKEVSKEPKFAICAKIAYGEKRASEIIEFMEYHLHFGASPILIYQFYDLNMEAKKVFQYYIGKGDLEVITYPKVPLLGQYRRDIRVVTDLSINDYQIADFDAQQRLRFYKYFAIMDTDEFIVPGKNITNFVQLMQTLVKDHKNAASFHLLSEVHFKDWKPTNNESHTMIGRYGYHTKPLDKANKNIFLSDRVVPGTVWIEGASSKKEFERIHLKKEEAVLKHFRFCKRLWVSKETKQCTDYFKMLRGHFMDNVADKIKENVLKVKQVVGIV